MVRPGELRQARWDQIDFDRRLWSLPAAVMKARREHTVCLSSYAIDVLKRLKEINGSGDLVFPGIRSAKRPISDMTLAAALARMGFTSDEHTPHGTRASTATLAGEFGWSADVVERAQARRPPGGPVRQVYDRGDRLDDRRALAEWLGLALEAIRLELEIPAPEWRR
jgi:integrase